MSLESRFAVGQIANRKGKTCRIARRFYDPDEQAWYYYIDVNYGSWRPGWKEILIKESSLEAKDE